MVRTGKVADKHSAVNKWDLSALFGWNSTSRTAECRNEEARSCSIEY